MDFSLYALTSGLIDAGRRGTVTDGIESAIHLYYDDYTDADELDVTFLQALEAIAVYADTPLAEIVAKVEAQITDETSRIFASTSTAPAQESA